MIILKINHYFAVVSDLNQMSEFGDGVSHQRADTGASCMAAKRCQANSEPEAAAQDRAMNMTGDGHLGIQVLTTGDTDARGLLAPDLQNWPSSLKAIQLVYF